MSQIPEVMLANNILHNITLESQNFPWVKLLKSKNDIAINQSIYISQT